MESMYLGTNNANKQNNEDSPSIESDKDAGMPAKASWSAAAATAAAHDPVLRAWGLNMRLIHFFLYKNQ